MADIRSQFYYAAARALGQVDLNPLSTTRGCSDRNFWHYQDGKGFAVGSFHSAIIGFTVAAKFFNDPERNIYKSTVDLMSKWWADIILQQGFLDEYFKNQKSFCATAHTTLAIAFSGIHFGLSPRTKAALQKSLANLARQSHRPVSANQVLAARIAWDLCKENDLCPNLETQNPFEITFSKGEWSYPLEYDGFDLGYTLKCLDQSVLALTLLRHPEKRNYYSEKIIQPILTLLKTLVVDYTFHSALSSRGNPHRLLGGLSVLAKHSKTAVSILEELENPQRFTDLVPAESSDDKYLCFLHLTSLALRLHAELNLGEIFKEAIPAFEIQEQKILETRHLEDLDLLLIRRKNVRFAMSLLKGGSYCVETQQGMTVNSGYASQQGKRMMSTWGFQSTLKGLSSPNESSQIWICSLQFIKHSHRALQLQGLLSSLIIRFLTGMPFLSDLFRHLAYQKKNSAPIPLGFREIILDELTIKIIDNLEMPANNLTTVNYWNFTDGHATRMHCKPQSVFAIAKSPTKSEFIIYFNDKK